MPATQVEIRDGVYDKIVAEQLATNFSDNDFDIAKTYFPQEDLEDLATKPKVKIVGKAIRRSRERLVRNTAHVVLETQVEIALQQRVDPTDTTTIDALILLVEELMLACEDDELVTGKDYNWIETDPLRDENGLVYSYEAMRISGVFQAIFIVNHQIAV
tara:strand:+ start:684 stop:1160 length:477 start_codon:yes stop_codon:yes gene_type:complete